MNLRVIIILSLLSFFLADSASFANPSDKSKTELRVNVPVSGSPERYIFDRFLVENPDVIFAPVGGIKLEGTASNASFFMAMAGGTAPDVFFSAMENIDTYYSQDFMYPLDKIAPPDEPLLKDMKDLAKPILIKGGHCYAIPSMYKANAMAYRRDLFEKNGLPPRGPATWDELFDFSLKIQDPENGVYGYGIYGGSWLFCQTIWEAGGNYFRYGWVNKESGKFTASPGNGDTMPEKCEYTGLPFNASRDKPTIRSTFQDKPGQRAVNYYRRLLFCQWAKDSSGQKMLFRDIDIDTGKFILYKTVKSKSTGTEYEISKDGTSVSDGKHSSKLYTGVALVANAAVDVNDIFKRFNRGGIGILILGSGAGRDGRLPDLNQKTIGLCPTQIGPSGTMVTMASANVWCINSQIADDKKNAAWRFLKFMCSDEVKKMKVSKMVEDGEASYVLPEYLKMAGYEEYVIDVPKDWAETTDLMLKAARPNPSAKGWPVVMGQVSEMLESLFTRPDADVPGEMSKKAAYCDTIFALATGETKSEKMSLPVKYLISALIFAIFILIGWFMYKMAGDTLATNKALETDSFKKKTNYKYYIFPVLFMLPAISVIFMFEYLPLIRGTFMAFYDFKILGKSTFTGIDNFVDAFVSKEFWWSMYVSVKYMIISLTVGFFLPIIVALMLDEIRWGKTFFRVIFYLPAVTSGLVIMLLWKEFYDPTPAGLLNTLFSFAGMGPFEFLKDPNLALLCVVIPGAWAGAGPGSILYLAALKCVPTDLYEAGAIDGARWYHKIRYITLPTLAPLIIINFIGAFLGAMQGMGNILVMTGGGPDRETQVVAIEIFYNAYVYLKFGYATSMAWILAAMLLLFTALKMRIIKSVDFTTSEGN